MKSSRLLSTWLAALAIVATGCSNENSANKGSQGTNGGGGSKSIGSTGGTVVATSTATQSGQAGDNGGRPNPSSSGGTASEGGNSGSAGNTPSGGVAGAGGTTGHAGSGGTGGSAGSGGATSGGNGGTDAGAGGLSAGRGGSARDGGVAGAAGPTVVAGKPPMGWNSWNTFACDGLNETVIKGVADIMVSSGMAAAGYQFVNLDDCWMDGRDTSGNLRWNATKFPNGAKIVEYVHGKGLKIGLYETPNTATCGGLFGGNPSVLVGSLGHESQDAKIFASWGIDYLKYDCCYGKMTSFGVMRDALRATGRDIVYSINPGCFPPKTCSIDVKTTANLWRIGFDIGANWNSIVGMIDQNKENAALAGPGHWNDPDMLEVGKGMSADEDRAHFGLWAMMAAPLLAGNDIRSMSATTKAILTNPDVIAVDQDELGVQATVVATPGTNLEIWSKRLSGTNARAVALFNRSGSATAMTVQWSVLGIPAGSATVRDLWNQKDLGSFTDSYKASSVPSHGVVMLKVVSDP